MDISQDMLINVGLDMIGFLAAGGLLLVIYSMFQRRNHQPVRQQQQQTPVLSTTSSSTVSAPSPVRSQMEFVRFGEPQSVSRQGKDISDNQSEGWSKRASVIKTARNMITAGASVEDVRAALPLSDAELAVLMRKAK